MSFVNVLNEMWDGVGLVATSIPRGIFYVPSATAINNKAMVFGILSGDPASLATTSAFHSGCIMLNTAHTTEINAGTLGTPAWVVISTA